MNTGGPKGAVASVALFESNASKIPSSQRQVEWDVVTPGAATGVEQDRIVLAVLNGKVRLDELRMGTTWESVITRTE